MNISKNKILNSTILAIIIVSLSLLLNSCNSMDQNYDPLTGNTYSEQTDQQTLNNVASILTDVENLSNNNTSATSNSNHTSNQSSALPSPVANQIQSSNMVNIPPPVQVNTPSMHQYQNVDINIVESGHSNVTPSQTMQEANQTIENAAATQQGNSLIINKRINLDDNSNHVK